MCSLEVLRSFSFLRSLYKLMGAKNRYIFAGLSTSLSVELLHSFTLTLQSFLVGC